MQKLGDESGNISPRELLNFSPFDIKNGGEVQWRLVTSKRAVRLVLK